MRFVAAKSEEQHAAAMVFRVRDLVVRQRTRTINAIRGHLAEFGLVAAQRSVSFMSPSLLRRLRPKILPSPQLPVRSCLCSLSSCGRWMTGWPHSTAR